MTATFSAVFEQDGDWWIGSVEELLGTLVIEANCALAQRETTGKSVIRESLDVTL